MRRLKNGNKYGWHVEADGSFGHLYDNDEELHLCEDCLHAHRNPHVPAKSDRIVWTKSRTKPTPRLSGKYRRKENKVPEIEMDFLH